MPRPNIRMGNPGQLLGNSLEDLVLCLNSGLSGASQVTWIKSECCKMKAETSGSDIKQKETILWGILSKQLIRHISILQQRQIQELMPCMYQLYYQLRCLARTCRSSHYVTTSTFLMASIPNIRDREPKRIVINYTNNNSKAREYKAGYLECSTPRV